eukprot:9271943-Lingulodinium_polyedra.AAC.1
MLRALRVVPQPGPATSAGQAPPPLVGRGAGASPGGLARFRQWGRGCFQDMRSPWLPASVRPTAP